MQAWPSGCDPCARRKGKQAEHSAPEGALEMRSTCVTVTFRSAFRLPGYVAPFSAGTYEVLSEDERLDGLSFEAFRRVATFLRISGQDSPRGRTELFPVSQADLDAAVLADQTGHSAAAAAAGSPEKDKR